MSIQMSIDMLSFTCRLLKLLRMVRMSRVSVDCRCPSAPVSGCRPSSDATAARYAPSAAESLDSALRTAPRAAVAGAAGGAQEWTHKVPPREWNELLLRRRTTGMLITLHSLIELH